MTHVSVPMHTVQSLFKLVHSLKLIAHSAEFGHIKKHEQNIVTSHYMKLKSVSALLEVAHCTGN